MESIRLSESEFGISVVLVTYNRVEKLKLSIQDILAQSFSQFELIICDDCSPDQTQEVCLKFANSDSRVRYIRNANNLKMPGNLNAGIKLAKFEYVAILHDADRYDINLLQTWYDIFSKHPTVSLVFSQHAIVNNNNEIIKIYKHPYSHGLVSGKSLIRQGFFRSWSFSSEIFGISMIRKSLVEGLGFFNAEYDFYADVDMWMALLHHWNAYYITYPLIRSYVQPHQFDDNRWRVGSMIQKMFLKHRHIEFKEDNWLRKQYEFFLHHFYCYLINFYRLSLIYKHREFNNVSFSRKYIFEDTKLLIPVWFIVSLLINPARFSRIREHLKSRIG